MAIKIFFLLLSAVLSLALAGFPSGLSEDDLLHMYNDRLVADNKDARYTTDVTETYFLLFTAATGTDGVEIPVSDFDAALDAAGFDPAKKTVFLMHGFGSGEAFVDEFVPELLEYGDFNVFGVLWPTLAAFPFVFTAAENAVNVGEYAGQFAVDLIEQRGLRQEDIHLVGHSYGAQGMGHMGRTIAYITGQKVARLTRK